MAFTALETRPQPAQADPGAAAPQPDGPPASGGPRALLFAGADPAFPAPEALLGEELGGYRLEKILGGGGMGVVFEARRTERASFAGPEVAAVKVLSAVFASDPEFVERFRREAEALITLRHPNLIEVFAKGEWSRPGGSGPPSYFFVMERFFGEDLRSLLGKGPVPPLVAAAIVRGAAAGLAFAHRHGIVHRDVKPANILVSGDPTRGGQVKVVDFGVAQLAAGQYTLTSLTRSHLILGTINYMSPEQRVDASGIDHRADVYALGVVAYELLTGRLPIGTFEAPSELASLPRAADRVLFSALRREPSQRPSGTLELAQLLEDALTRRGARRLVAVSAGVAVAVLAGLLGAGIGADLGPFARRAPVMGKGTREGVAQVAETAAKEPAPPVTQQLSEVANQTEPRRATYTPAPELPALADTVRVATQLGLTTRDAPPEARAPSKGKVEKPTPSPRTKKRKLVARDEKSTPLQAAP